MVVVVSSGAELEPEIELETLEAEAELEMDLELAELEELEELELRLSELLSELLSLVGISTSTVMVTVGPSVSYGNVFVVVNDPVHGRVYVVVVVVLSVSGTSTTMVMVLAVDSYGRVVTVV